MAEEKHFAPTYDPSKRYEFTWPGCLPSVVGGEALNHLVRGADYSKLNIRELGARSDPFSIEELDYDEEPTQP